jgi:ribosomal protein S18 acetylase RimI-like enzyme
VTAPAFTIREFRFPEDYPAVTDLWSNAGPGIHLRKSDTPDEIAKKLLRDPDLFLVAEMDRAMIGAVIGGFDGRRGVVYHLAVAPERRQMGIGDALMTELEKRLRAKGCIRCNLLVDTANEDALHFYEERGWECLPLFVYGKDL